MCANENVNASASRIFDCLADLFGGAEALKNSDPDVKFGNVLSKNVVMLHGQDSGSHSDGYLLASIDDRFEGCTHGHFSLAVAHVSADQTVHGFLGQHILFDVCNGSELVFGLAEGKLFFKGGEVFAIGLIREASLDLAAGVDMEQLGGIAHDGAFGLLFGRFPAVATQSV